MVAYSFNAQQHTPSYGAGGGGLPAGPNGENVKYKVVIVNSAPTDTKDSFGNVKGGYLGLELACVEGPQKDVKHTDRLNLMHSNPEVVRIANGQLSAYCHVIGKFQFNDTQELHGIPFVVEVGLQKGEEARAKGYTEVKAIYDVNGNPPGKAGAGPQANAGQAGNSGGAPNGPPAGGVQGTGSWGGDNGGGQGQGGQGQQGGFGGGQGGGGFGGGGQGGEQQGGGQQGGGFGNGGGQGGQAGGWGGQQGGTDPNAGQGQNGGGQGGQQGAWGGQGGQAGQGQGGGQQGGAAGGWGGQGGGQAGGGAAGWGQAR